MKLSDAAKYLPFVQAAAEGKQIEWKSAYYSDNKWRIMSPDDLVFDDHNEYRIKPEPKLRPWKPEEVPITALFKTYIGAIYIPVSKDENGRLAFMGVTEGSQGKHWYTALQLCNPHLWLHSTDNGKTWHPCGVME